MIGWAGVAPVRVIGEAPTRVTGLALARMTGLCPARLTGWGLFGLLDWSFAGWAMGPRGFPARPRVLVLNKKAFFVQNQRLFAVF